MLASQSMVINGYHVGRLLKKTGEEILEDNVLGLSAQNAYFFFFSLFPMLLFLAPLSSLVGDQQRIVTEVLDYLRETLPPEAYLLLQNVVRDVVFGENAPGLVSLGLLLALFSGSAVTNSLIGALNRAFDVTEGRPWWKRRLLAIGFTAGAAFSIGLATVTILAGSRLIRWIAGLIELDEYAALVWTFVQYAVAFSILVGFLFVTYLVLPNVSDQNRKHVLIGALLSAILWLGVTLGFRLYVTNFANYNQTYGTIGAVIILLTWMYLTMLVVLSVGEFISELHIAAARVDTRATEASPRK